MRRSGVAAMLTASFMVAILLTVGGAVSYPEHSAAAVPAVGTANSYDLNVVPLVDFLELPQGINCDYGHGSAVLVLTGGSAVVTVNVQDDLAHRTYDVVLMTNGANQSLGTVTIDGSGSGSFNGSLVLPSVLASAALHLYYVGPVPMGCFSLDLVALPYPLQIYGTSTSSSTYVQSSTTHTSTETSTSTISSGSTTAASSSTTVSGGANASSGLQFRLVSVPSSLLLPEPLNYPFDSGNATLILYGRSLHASVDFTGSPGTRFTMVLRANDQNITLGSVSTDGAGSARFTSTASLGDGEYLLGLRIYQTGGPTVALVSSSLVAVSSPLALPVVVGQVNATTSSTMSSTQSLTGTSTQSGGQFANGSQNAFSLLGLSSVSLSGTPSSYVQGAGVVELDLRDGVLDVSVQLTRANPDTQYGVVMRLGGSNITLGTCVTNREGNAQLSAEVPPVSGKYTASFFVFDDSSFSIPRLVMVGGATQVSVVSASSGSVSTASQAQTQRPTIDSVSGGQLATAVANGTIPAEVQISSSGETLNIIDDNFSVSVGRLSDTGVVITVSGQNVTGPRTFLIDVNGSMAQSITSGSFQILFDGQEMSEAPSLSAVLAPQPGAPASYAVVQTSSGVQLLVLVPHFSTHVIEILGVSSFESMRDFLEVSLPVLVGTVFVITLVFGAVYAYRRKL